MYQTIFTCSVLSKQIKLMKRFIFSVCITLTSISLFAQKESFTLRPDGSFKNRSNQKNYVIVQFPGISQQELYHNFLVVLQNKCIALEGQYAVVPDKSINIYRHESKINFRTGGFWGSAAFNGYLYYKFLFQFRDGQVRIEAPIVDHLGSPYTKSESYMQFNEVLDYMGLFDKEGNVKEKKREAVEKLEDDANSILTDIINSVSDNMKW